MTHNVSAGVVLSTQSLVMQGVTRGHAGHYVCKAANDQGETTSQPVRLRVKCKYPALSDSPCVTPGPRGSWGRMLSEDAAVSASLLAAFCTQRIEREEGITFQFV